MFPEWSWIMGLAFGAAIGSFLNVVIYRMPRGMSLSNPPNSFCPKCKHRLLMSDMIPLFTWLIQRGKCKYCGERIPSRYFFVELLNGAIWAGIWWQYLIAGDDWVKALCYALAASTLVAIIFIDWELYIIPDQINAFLLFLGLAYNAWLFAQGSAAATTWGIPSSVAGALVGVLILWGIAFLGRLLFGKDAMGHGDIKMARGIGAILFPALSVVSFGLAVGLGAILGVAQIFLRPRKVTQEVAKPDSHEGREQSDVPANQTLEDEEEYEPESIGSLLKCGLGYILCIDVIGLFVPKLYKAWFNEDPFAPLEDLETFEADFTMIPFGPYLALGAIVGTVFEKQLLGAARSYWHWAAGD
ncbi:MAG: prepilin peptidase [Chlorobia bacterium]|nr:prepilin peptidase [Fimbriimonadaceae bacterium]